ncbi:RNA-directed DNA polymerase, eukaryota, reverse transcriptase zinc-binding domain protein [Tanacetum coccineum]
MPTPSNQLSLREVDFEKAFDSVRWDYLDAVMEKIGFDIKWRSWISGCLKNARSSILVNGSPTKEFELFKGLRQGDPLSPFLFILAMEGLHSLTYKAEELCLFTGASIGRDNMRVSHLISTSIKVVSLEWVFLIGCGVSNLPFKYLGIPVGCNMSHCVHWNAVIQSFTSKLSSWKARLLSVGGRLSLIKAVLGNLPTYFMSIYLMPVSVRSKLESMRSKFFRGADPNESKMSWIKWEKCLSSKKKGGLGIGSIYGLNISLLFKWIWRFLTRPSDLWAKVIRSIYGHHGGVLSDMPCRLKKNTWGSILSSVKRLKEKGIDLLSLCSLQFPRVHNLDTDRNCTITNRIPLIQSNWCSVFKRSLRGGAEMNQFESLKAAIGDVILSDQSDYWVWSLDVNAGFSVMSARILVDGSLLEAGIAATRWIRHIPIKINVFLWRLNLNSIPSRVNLDRRGIEVDSLLCPTRYLDVETVNHIFFNCEMAKDLWALLAKWWELDIPICANISEWYSWLDGVRVASKSRLILEGVGFIFLGLSIGVCALLPNSFLTCVFI